MTVTECLSYTCLDVLTPRPYSNSDSLRTRYGNWNGKVACQASELWLFFFSNKVISDFCLLVSFFLLNNPLFTHTWCIWTAEIFMNKAWVFDASFNWTATKVEQLKSGNVSNNFLSIFVGLSQNLHIMNLEKWLYGPGKKDPQIQETALLFWKKFEDIKISAS